MRQDKKIISLSFAVYIVINKAIRVFGGCISLYTEVAIKVYHDEYITLSKLVCVYTL